MITRKSLLTISGIISVGLVIVGTTGTYALCRNEEDCIKILHFAFLNLVPIFPLFIFSLITYWMPETIYRAWFKFALVWIPLSMLLIFISPEYSSDWMYRIEKGSVAFGMSALFVIISTLIIVGTYLRAWVGRKKI